MAGCDADERRSTAYGDLKVEQRARPRVCGKNLKWTGLGVWGIKLFRAHFGFAHLTNLISVPETHCSILLIIAHLRWDHSDLGLYSPMLASRNRMSFHVVDNSITQGCELSSWALELILVYEIPFVLVLPSPLMTALACFDSNRHHICISAPDLKLAPARELLMIFVTVSSSSSQSSVETFVISAPKYC